MIRRSVLTLVLLLFVYSFAQAQTSKPTITLAPIGCQGLSVHVIDYAKSDQGLADVEVLWDSLGIYTGQSFVSYNVVFDGPEPQDYYQNPADSFKLTVLDPTDSAYV